MIDDQPRRFALKTAAIETPCFFAIALIVSPARTTYDPVVGAAAGGAAGGAAGAVGAAAVRRRTWPG